MMSDVISLLAMAKFRVTVFDPVLLLAQMAGVQAAFYVVAGTLAAVLGSLVGAPASLSVLFDYHALRTDAAVGWFTAAAFLVSAVAAYARRPAPLAPCMHRLRSE
jgi:hypothetical protein